MVGSRRIGDRGVVFLPGGKMKRDMDLVRRILLELRQKDIQSGWTDIELKDVEPIVVSYHIKIMEQGGLIEAYDDSSMHSDFEWKPLQITWDGHDFLDAASNQSIWNQAKGRIAELGGAVSSDVFRLLLKTLVKQKLGLETE